MSLKLSNAVIIAALVEIINAPPGQRPPAFDTIARLMYPPRGISLLEQEDGVLLVIVKKWGFQYKHRGPKPKVPPPADCEGIRQVFSQQLAEVEIISVEDHGSQVWVFIKGVNSK